jgi:hypothetical protein
MVILAGAAQILFGVLLIASGVGYLKLRRFLGRTLGIVYGAASVIWGVVVLAFLQSDTGEDAGLWNLIGFVYPAVTLFALLGPFKHDFVRP